MRRALCLAPVLFSLAACETTNSDDWTGGEGTPFNQAERTCLSMVADVEEETARRDFFIGCMSALGWAPKPGASIEL